MKVRAFLACSMAIVALAACNKSPQEQAANPRSASVRLRAAERTRLTPSTKGPHR